MCIRDRGSKEFDRFMESEKSKLNIQRFKGLGEMNPEELWSTTLNPDTRNLLQVQYSKDLKKDQTYFMHGILSKDLPKFIFPLGKLSKEEVRSIAIKKNFISCPF